MNSIGKDGAVGAVHQLIPTAPNAHAIHADASNRHVFATSLGGDHLSAWRFDAESGRLTAHESALTTVAPENLAPATLCGTAPRPPCTCSTNWTPP